MASYRRVLVGTDGSSSSYRAVERAAAIAKEAGAQLLIACAYRHGADAASADDVLRGASEHAGADQDVDTIAIEGEPIDVLVDLAKQREADLVVVGNRGMGGIAGRLLGSVPSVVAHRAPCDVLIVATT